MHHLKAKVSQEFVVATKLKGWVDEDLMDQVDQGDLGSLHC